MQVFHQVTCELFTDDLDEVIRFLRALLTRVISAFCPALDGALLDLVEAPRLDRPAFLNALNDVIWPTNVRHKTTGTPPFLKPAARRSGWRV